MNVEIISTGEEVLTGAVTDTNSAWIAALMEENGHKVIRHTTVGDDFNALAALFAESGKRSEITIVTGGLGPTSDDRTAEAAAKASGCVLKENVSALKSVQNFFGKYGREMTDADKKQTLLPESSECILNDSGTAPGFSLSIESAKFFFLPGVPWEMKSMMKKYVLPAVDDITGETKQKSIKHSFFLFGLPEAVVGERLHGIQDSFPGLFTGFRADFPVIEIKLWIDGGIEKAGTLIKDASNWVEQKLGDYIFSDTSGKMEAIAGRLLAENKKTLCVAESCTGGLIGHKLTNVAGSSDYFLASFVTYSNAAKINILGVKPETLDKYGAVSSETVGEMAEGARRITGADYAIATSGIAGPGGGSREKPVGMVYIGFSSIHGTKTYEFVSPFRDRIQNKIIFCVKALDLLRREITFELEA